MATTADHGGTITLTARTVQAGDRTYALANVTRIAKAKVPADDTRARLVAGMTALLAILAFAGIVNGATQEGLALGFGAVIAAILWRRLRGADTFLTRIETSAGSTAVFASRHEGVTDRLVALLREAMERPDPATVHRVDLDAGTVETVTVEPPDEAGPDPASSPPASRDPFSDPARRYGTRWHRIVDGAPDGLDEELAVFSRDVRGCFDEDDWASERVLMLLESELVSPQPRQRLAENLWKEIRAAAPRTGRLEAEFRRLLDWPRNNHAA